MSESIKCKKCGKFFDSEFGICPYCGTELPEGNTDNSNVDKVGRSADNSIEVHKDKNTEDKFIICPRCHNKSDSNTRFCVMCGYNLSELDKKDVLPTENQNKSLYTSTADKADSVKSDYGNKRAENNLASKNQGFFSKHKKGIIIGIIIAIILLIVIIYMNSGYVCSQCGKRFHEGKSVFGEYWCNDCFWGK